MGVSSIDECASDCYHSSSSSRTRSYLRDDSIGDDDDGNYPYRSAAYCVQASSQTSS